VFYIRNGHAAMVRAALPRRMTVSPAGATELPAAFRRVQRP
jgi:hypothetical protein